MRIRAGVRGGPVALYDNFGKAGYSLTDYNQKWMTPNGLFSLLDAFPFQHPEAPDLSVSIPVGDASGRGAAGRARLFGQGAGGSFGNFTTLTITGPAGKSNIVSALAAARS